MSFYLKSGLVLAKGMPNDPDLVRALQHDLRALGYQKQGITGLLGDGTVNAIRALQTDLMKNDGTGTDGSKSPVAITSYNKDASGNARVQAVTGQLDQALAACLDALMADDAVTKLPSSDNPRAANTAAIQALTTTFSTIAPTPFVSAMVIQESAGCHFHVPGHDDEDTFVTIGLDRNDRADSDHITSRGYGIGQYTFFHHPLSQGEIDDFVLDPVRNVQNAYKELRDKFDNFLVIPKKYQHACDRDVEHPHLALRLCKYQPSNPLYMRDCAACAAAAHKVNIDRGTPHYAGALTSYQTDQYYPSATYSNVPNRADFLCDWPYAARRYNGRGNDSFHYQTRILKNLLK